MDILYSIEERMCEELGIMDKKPELSPSDIDMIGKMVDVVKDVATYEAMKNSQYSRENSFDYYGDTAMPRSRSYDDRRSYDNYSYRRERDAMGRFTSRDDQPHHDSMNMIDQLRSRMNNAKSESEREDFRRVIERLER